MPEKKDQDQQSKKQKKTSQQLVEMKELLQRTQASFENYRKQTEKRIQEWQKTAAKELMIQLLPIWDNFALALKNVPEKAENKEFIQGVEQIYSQFSKLLGDNGIKEVETKNKQFDPYLHEALMKVESELPENFIIEEFQKGLTWHEQILRPARVKISAGRKSQEDKENNQYNANDHKNTEKDQPSQEETKEEENMP